MTGISIQLETAYKQLIVKKQKQTNEKTPQNAKKLKSTSLKIHGLRTEIATDLHPLWCLSAVHLYR